MFYIRKKRNTFKIFDSEAEATRLLPVGQLARIEAGSTELCLAHLNDGFFAFSNACPHQGAPLSHGKCLGAGQIECAYHRYRFDIRSGKDLTGQGNDLDVYPIKIEKDGVYVIV